MAATQTELVASYTAAGMTLTSASTPELNRTYAIDATAEAAIGAEAVRVMVFGAFSSGLTLP